MTTEQEFLASYNVKDFDQPLFSVDSVVFRYFESQLQVLLVKRKGFPFKGRHALPGGFVDVKNDHCLNDVALRKVRDKTGVEPTYCEQLNTHGSPDRDPRGWSATTIYLAFLRPQSTLIEDANELAIWANVSEVDSLDLAFDHLSIVNEAFKRLHDRCSYTLIGAALLGETFTLSALQSLHEHIFAHKVEKKAFRRRVEASGQLIETGEYTAGRGRPAMIYKLCETALEYSFVRAMD